MVTSEIFALPNLQGLQEAAKSDQSPDCMAHEYMRRYNEVLREFAKTRGELTGGIKAKAHEEAMKWVKDVWKFADPMTVQKAINSRDFRESVEKFRDWQARDYPNLSIVS